MIRFRPGGIGNPPDGLDFSKKAVQVGCALAGEGIRVSQARPGLAETGLGLAETGLGLAETGLGLAETGLGLAEPGLGLAGTGVGRVCSLGVSPPGSSRRFSGSSPDG